MSSKNSHKKEKLPLPNFPINTDSSGSSSSSPNFVNEEQEGPFSPNTQLMIDELGKHLNELVESHNQIKMVKVSPRQVLLKNDGLAIEDQEECISDMPTDYSCDSDGGEEGGLDTISNTAAERKVINEEDNPEKAWINFNSVNFNTVVNEQSSTYRTNDSMGEENSKTTPFVEEPESYVNNLGTSRGMISNGSKEISQECASPSTPLAGDTFPDNILVRITSINLDPPIKVETNSKMKYSIRLIIHSVMYQTKPTPELEEHFEKVFCFPFDYHSLVFDTLKVDVYEHGNFLSNKNRLGRSTIKLSDLKGSIEKGLFTGSFPLESNSTPDLSEVGKIDLKIKFHFPKDPPLSIPSSKSDTNSFSQRFSFRSKSVLVAPKSKTTDPPPSTNKSQTTKPDSVSDAKQVVATDVENTDESEFANIATRIERTTSLGILDFCLSQETKEAIKEITVLYHAFFGHGWRLSKLDFLKAYMLLEKYYTQMPNPVTGKTMRDVEKLQSAQRFLKYSMAAYGSFLFNWFGYGNSKAPLNAIRLNSDRKSVQEFFGLGKDDIICWEYGQHAVSVPSYMIVRDPETNSIIVSIRGTINITDVITDVLAHYEPWNGGFVHRGVLRSAQYLVERSINDIRDAVTKFNSSAICVIGHSLGASISSIVTLTLRERCTDLLARGIDIHAWNFATAPCCSLDLACKAESEACIDNFVNENDVIPRLSYGNLMDFKELVKFAASELKNEKYKKLSPKDKLAELLQSIDTYRAALKASSSERKVYIPGTIYYMYKGFRVVRFKSNKLTYTKDIVCEKSTPDLFTDIALRKNWLFHHFPDRYDRKFKGVFKYLMNTQNEETESTKIDQPFWLKWKKESSK